MVGVQAKITMPVFNHSLAKIDEALFGLTYPTVPQLSEQLGVCGREVHRLLADLRSHHGLEIPIDPARKGYSFERWPDLPYAFGIFGDGLVGNMAKFVYALAYDFQLDLCTKWDHQAISALPVEMPAQGEGKSAIIASVPGAKLIEIQLAKVTIVGAKPFGGCPKTFRKLAVSKR